MQTRYNVLFLCTGNSARSIMAEGILNFKGRPNFTAYSAGSQPSGVVRPEALRQLEIAHIPISGLRSKSWEEFAQPGSPNLDFVLTVPDPAAVRGSAADIERAFRDAFFLLDRRISLFLSLPLKSLKGLALQRELDNIGQAMAPVDHK